MPLFDTAGAGSVGGSGSAGVLSKFSAGTTLADSILSESGSVLTLAGTQAIAGGTVTASTPVLDLSQTWNLAGTTFTGLKVNVTDTASASVSLLADFQVGGVSKGGIYKSGSIQFSGNGTFTAGSLTLNDTVLLRGAANTLDLRNGSNAQTFQVYGTYTDSSNYRRLRSTMTTGGAVTIAAEGLGTGVSGNTLAFAVGTGGSPTTVFTIDGTLLTFADAKNVVFNATTGTKLGTATTQKLGFWNATPIVQPSSTGETVGFTAGGGTTVTDSSTFTGNVGSTAYRLSDIVKALKNSGLIAS